MKINALVFLLFLLPIVILSQNDNTLNMSKDKLPYYNIPDAPDTYTGNNILSRMVDGVGYRYYWATEGLREEDLKYNPGNEGKNTLEVLGHILDLSRFILNVSSNQVQDRGVKYPELNWSETRKTTLNNLKKASDVLREVGDVSQYKIVFKRGEQMSEYPFWNLINGPISDAIYHTGQIVSYRRSSGNPISPNVNVFTGKTRE